MCAVEEGGADAFDGVRHCSRATGGWGTCIRLVAESERAPPVPPLVLVGLIFLAAAALSLVLSGFALGLGVSLVQ